MNSVDGVLMEDAFQDLEIKLKSVICDCDKSHLVEVITKDQPEPRVPNTFKGLFDVKNASRVDHYLIDGAIHVYKFFDEQGHIINYWLSPKPVYKKTEITLFSGKNISEYQKTGVSFIEYTIGGIGNSLGMGYGEDQYTAVPKISTVVFKRGYRVDVFSAPGCALRSGNESLKIEDETFHKVYSLLDYIKRLGKVEFTESGLPHELDDTSITFLNDVINKIAEHYAKVESNNLSSKKKGILKKLLTKNKELDLQTMNAFGPKKG